jgi:hypothetical protein
MRKVLLTAIFACLPLTAAIATPKIVVPETHWDYGNVPQNATLSHDYVVKNVGDDTLRITDVKPG